MTKLWFTDTENHPLGAPKLTRRYVGISVIATFLISTLAGILFAGTYRVFSMQTVISELVYSHSVGWLILSIILGGRHLIWPNTAPNAFGLLLLGLVGVAAAWYLGVHLGARINGHPPPDIARLTSSHSIPGLIMTALSAFFGILFFRNREQVAYLRIETEKQARLAETIQRQLTAAQLSTLQAQLEPHMLFNTLANLRALISVDPAAAQLMLDKLNSFLRATLSSTRKKEVLLEEEFALLGDYLALMKIRLGERLTFTLNCPGNLLSTKVPPLLLQPLVENAIKHGIEPYVENGHIMVEARRVGAKISLIVSNSCPQAIDSKSTLPSSPSTTTTHFGLIQLGERLAQLYGDRASFSFSPASASSMTTQAQVLLPCD
jgi:Histidine kinase